MKTKKLIGILLALALLCSFAVPLAAAENAVIGYALVRMEDKGERPDSDVPDSDDNRANMKYPEPLGTIFSTTSVAIHTGDTVADVIENFIALKGGTTMHYGTTKDGYYLTGVTVTDEQNRALVMGEKDAGSSSGWMTKYNNWFTSSGAQDYIAEDGDVVEIVYSCSWGADIGNDFFLQSAKITGLSITTTTLESRNGVNVGKLTPAFSKDVKDYTLTVPAGTSSIRASVELESYSAKTTYTLIDNGTETEYKYFRDIPVKDGADLKIETTYYAIEYDENYAPIGSSVADTDAITIHLQKEGRAASFLQMLRDFFQRIWNYLTLMFSILKLR